MEKFCRHATCFVTLACNPAFHAVVQAMSLFKCTPCINALSFSFVYNVEKTADQLSVKMSMAHQLARGQPPSRVHFYPQSIEVVVCTAVLLLRAVLCCCCCRSTQRTVCTKMTVKQAAFLPPKSNPWSQHSAVAQSRALLLQINSVDYTYEDGKTVQSSRLPGYSGVAGLDVDQDMLKRKKEEQDGQKVSCTSLL